ncbi:hypothetical protein AaE_002753, partial [Aphanomyces astaci]
MFKFATCIVVSMAASITTAQMQGLNGGGLNGMQGGLGGDQVQGPMGMDQSNQFGGQFGGNMGQPSQFGGQFGGNVGQLNQLGNNMGGLGGAGPTGGMTNGLNTANANQGTAGGANNAQPANPVPTPARSVPSNNPASPVGGGTAPANNAAAPPMGGQPGNMITGGQPGSMGNMMMDNNGQGSDISGAMGGGPSLGPMSAGNGMGNGM